LAYYFLFLGLATLAVDNAIATACFCGLPSLTILEMFLLIVFCDLPLASGIVIPYENCCTELRCSISNDAIIVVVDPVSEIALS